IQPLRPSRCAPRCSECRRAAERKGRRLLSWYARVHESRNRRPATIRRAKPPRIRHRPRRHARLGAPQYRCAPPGTAAHLDRVDVGTLDVARTLLSVRTDKSVGATLLLQLEI